MSTVQEIEDAIAKLPPEEFQVLLHRLRERDAEAWDGQIEEDAGNGKLDRMFALLMKEEGGEPHRPLDEVLDHPKLS